MNAYLLNRTTAGGWAASGIERLAVVLRAREVPVGVVTDGRWWALVWAPIGGTTGAAVWDGGLFSEDPASLRALVALLHRSRFLAVAPADTLPALLRESLERGEEVTETLGQQVRDAVEMLAATLDRLDREASGRLLAGVRCAEICERAGRVYWLNPEPRRFWNEGDSVIGRYAPLCAQVRECRTLRQIADFVESLTVGSAASLPAHQLAS